MKGDARTRWGWALVAMLVVAAAAGCTQSETVSNSVGNLSVQIETTGSMGRYDTSAWALNNLVVRPVDPLAQDSLGDQVLSFGAQPFPMDLLGTPPNTVTVVNLAAGTYEILSITLQDFYLRDASGPLPNPANCAQAKTAIPMIDTLLFDVFPSPFLFSVTPGGSHALAIRLDADEIVRRAEQYYDCAGNIDRVCRQQVDPPRGSSCVDSLSFRQDFIPDVMTVEQIR